MDELRMVTRLLGAAAVGYMLVGEALASQLYLWFGWRVTGPMTWLHGLIGQSL